MATYKGHRRELCPHVLGTKEGRRRPLFFQFGGGSSSALPPGGEWRCIPVDGLEDVVVRDGPWHTRRVTRAVIASSYAWAACAALTLALVRDPFYDPNCWTDCAGNALLVRSWPGLTDAISSARPWAELTLGIAVAALAAHGLIESVITRVAGLAALAVGAVASAHALEALVAPLEDPLDPAYRRIFLGASAAAFLVAVALAVPRARAFLRRRAVRRVVTVLDDAPAPDEPERSLRVALEDPTRRIVFWLPELGRCVDAVGAQCRGPVEEPGRGVVPLARRGERVGWIDHDASVVHEVERALTAAVCLAVDNTRLRAGLLAEVHDLRDARRRIVGEGDDERRRVERDLHDGVQQ